MIKARPIGPLNLYAVTYTLGGHRYCVDVYATSWEMAEMAAEMLPEGSVDGEIEGWEEA